MQQPLEAFTVITVRGSFEFLLRDANHLRLKALRRTSAALLASEVREKTIPGNATQPGSKIPATAETRKVPPGSDKNLLRQIIRFRDVVKLPGEITAQHQFIPPHYVQIQIRLTTFDAV